MTDFSFRKGVNVDKVALAEMLNAFPEKFGWFLSVGYLPHYWQTLFHANNNDGRLVRFRHLVAGRRGGKTLSAAWEVLFYCLFLTIWLFPPG